MLRGRKIAPCPASDVARPGLAVYSGAAAFRKDVEPRHRKPRPTALRRVQVDRMPIRADGRTDAEVEARPKSRGPTAALRAVAERLRAEEAEMVAGQPSSGSRRASTR